VDRNAGQEASRLSHIQDIYATVYRTLGIDVRRTTYADLSGRPHYLIDNEKYGVIPELI